MSEIPSQKKKLCPYCNAHLSLDAEVCFACKKKVGVIGKHGMAKKPINYWSYVVCAGVWIGFYLYIRWAFF